MKSPRFMKNLWLQRVSPGAPVKHPNVFRIFAAQLELHHSDAPAASQRTH